MPPQATTAAVPDDSKRQAAREVIDILHDISTLLASFAFPSRFFHLAPSYRVLTYTKREKNTHLDRTQLSLCVSLIENGVNPEALADVVRELRKEKEKADAGAGAVEGK